MFLKHLLLLLWNIKYIECSVTFSRWRNNLDTILLDFQKQPSINVLRKRCSENMQHTSAHFQNTSEHLCWATSGFFRILALGITKSNIVEIWKYILIRWNQTCFFQGHIISIYIIHLMYDSFSKKIQISDMDLKIIQR